MTAESSAKPLSSRQRELQALVQALRAGVVPAAGQQHIQVGRLAEVQAFLTDMQRVASVVSDDVAERGAGSAFRVLIGEYGSGKTFFLGLVKSMALEKKFVVLQADLTPERRLHATSGQARLLYAEALRSMSTRAKPQGGALTSVLDRLVQRCHEEAAEQGLTFEAVWQAKLSVLRAEVLGHDFCSVLDRYAQSVVNKDEAVTQAALRWLRGEYPTRTEARQALGVRSIIDDATVYDHLKLWAQLVRLAGYAGLWVQFDELVNLYKLAHVPARNANYEQVLRMLNDTLQGRAPGLGIVLAGTPEFLLDTRRGMHSYPALQSRLPDISLVAGLRDLNAPVLRLAALSAEEYFLLLQKVERVSAAQGEQALPALSAEDLRQFMDKCLVWYGPSFFQTPRKSIVRFMQCLSMREQYPQMSWSQLLGEDTPGASPLAAAQGEMSSAESDDEALADFKLG